VGCLQWVRQEVLAAQHTGLHRQVGAAFSLQTMRENLGLFWGSCCCITISCWPLRSSMFHCGCTCTCSCLLMAQSPLVSAAAAFLLAAG
jgi:hypothetical protein